MVRQKTPFKTEWKNWRKEKTKKKAEGDQTEEEHLQQRYDEENRLKVELNQKTIF